METSNRIPKLIARLALVAAVILTVVVGPRRTAADSTKPVPAFSTQEFLDPIKFLSSDALKGRGDGTPELNQAADYIAARFIRFGLKPAGDDGTCFQNFMITVGAKLDGNNSLIYESGDTHRTLTINQDFIPFSFSQDITLNAPLVFAGYGITAPEYHYDDYQGTDVKGKVVIVLRHEPQENDEKSVFAGKQLTMYSDILNKAINARNRGAVGMILVNDVGNHPGEPDELVRFGTLAGPEDIGVAVIQVATGVVDEWLKPTGHTLDELRQAIDKDLSNHSFALDPATRVAATVDVERIRKPVANVVGLLPGSDPTLARQAIVIGAHYDHLGLGEQFSLAPRQVGQIHHGADDNASGTSGVLELADFFAHRQAQPKHTIVFITFAGEELGLLGSSYYTAHPEFPLDGTIAMINMDMIGRVSKNRLYVGGTGTSPGFKKLVEDANQTLAPPTSGSDASAPQSSDQPGDSSNSTPAQSFDLSYSASGYGASDQTSFTVHNIPVLFFFSGLHSDYHKPSDTWDKIDARAGARVLELVAGVTDSLDQLAEKPQYVRVAEPASPASGGGGGYGPYFGSIPDFGEIEHGVKFADVRDGSPAAKAGFKAGDVLVEFDTKKIDNLYDFTYALRAHKPGDKVIVTVLRNGEKVTHDVILEVRK
ncbi:MAG TPA: M28 family peptidase [Terriglobia bacterium]|nr:M28 family peptidase [Terriglobia bacterium]